MTALIRVRRGQTDSEASAVNLEGQTTLFVIVGLPAQIGICRRILCQPLFERGIMRLNFDGFAGFVKIDAGRFLPFSQSGFLLPPFLPVLRKRAHFQVFFSALHPQKQADF